MVVAVLISYFAPSNRGFTRNKEADKLPFDSFHLHDEEQQNQTKGSSRRFSFGASRRRQCVTTLRRKPLRAMAILTSVASDFDLVSDWMFCYQSFQQDQRYREKHANNSDSEAESEEGELPYLIPPILLTSVFVICILGTITYLVLATEGRIIAPVMKRLGVDKISMGLMLFLTVLVEDIPQVVLTFLVEDYYEEGQFLSELAVVNLISSLYDTCIKLAESFDQRHDVVETGVWCKKSIVGHSATITDVIILPEGHIMPPPNKQRAVSEPALTRWSSVASTMPIQTTNYDGSMSLSDIRTAPFKRTSTKPLLVEAFFPDTEPLAPRIHFLTASMDMTIKLWDISSYTEHINKSSNSAEKQCVKVFQDIDSKGFTCLAWVGAHSQQDSSNGSDEGKVKAKCSYFLTGCNNGAAKLWDLSGVCHTTFWNEETEPNRVASIAATMVDDHHTFVCGHENGVIRIWRTWTGCCVREFLAHNKRITSLQFLQDGEHFVSASSDSTLKLWDTRYQMSGKQQAEEGGRVLSGEQDIDTSTAQHVNTFTPADGRDLLDCREMAAKKFQGHSGAILSVAIVDDKTALLSGSRDRTARLWSIASGLCLRVFRGHTDSVTSVQAIDRVTFLTGSKDTTIKAWDALSGECLRTYEGHSDFITGLSVVSVSPDETENASSFISSSADRSIKCWVLTSVSYRDPVAALEHILDFHENACQCFSSAENSYGINSPQSNLIRTAVSTGAYGVNSCDVDDNPYYQEPASGLTKTISEK